MADLYERLFPPNSETTQNISGHLFEAALIEYMSGVLTRTQIVNYWQLDAEAQSDLTSILDHVDALTTTINKLAFLKQLSAVITMASQGLLYTTKAAFAARLGL